ncbi:MAG: hypothetical protein AAGJ34_03030 [Pseudomonadota bacterium]
MVKQLMINGFAKIGFKVTRHKVFWPKDVVFIHIGKNAGTQIKHLSTQINALQSDTMVQP